MDHSSASFPARIPSLDGLRAAAVLIVTLGHAIPAPESPVPPSWHVVRFLAGSGVDLFFVISGYLITHLLLREYARHGRISLRAFWIRRSLRILPAYWFFLTMLLAAHQAGIIHVDPNSWLPAATYTYNFVPGLDILGTGHLWSLCVEEHFYLVWPLALVLLGRASAPLVLLLVLVACPILRFVLSSRSGPDIGYFTPTRIDTIAIGCLLAYFAHSSHSAKLAHFARRRGSLIVLACAATLLVSVYILSMSWKYYLGPRRLIEAVVIALLVFAAVHGSDGFVGRILNWRPVTPCGVLSYSIYLAQPLASAQFSPDWPLSWWWNLPLIALYATCSYLIVERPFLRLKDWFGRNPKLSPVETSGEAQAEPS